MMEAIVTNPVKVTVGVLLVALFGSIALYRMPTQLTPEVQTPTITIETKWPGASPQEIERQIVMEQEEQLQSVEGVTKMTGECLDSIGRIILEFPVGTDMREALLMVSTRLQQVPRYPVDADEPVISSSNSDDRPIAWFILKPKPPTPEEIAAFQSEHPEVAEALEPVRTARTMGLRLYRLRDLAEREPMVKSLLPDMVDVPTFKKFAEDFIEARLERVPGVSNANVLGGREEEMQVIVDPQQLASRRLTISDIRTALQGHNMDTSGGDIWEGKRRYVVRTLGQYRSPQQVADTIITSRDGQPVYVRDVAEVQLGYKKPDGFVKQLGQSCIAINAQRAVGANVMDVMAGLRVATQDLNERLLAPRGLLLEQVYDETEYITSAVGLVKDNIIIGGLLTTAVLLLFLRTWRATLVIALAIPTSILGTFVVMGLMGRSLNVISLAGLAFAVGMLVDNAVVVLENIYQHYQRGKSPLRSAVDGATEVWGAVLSSTLTTLAVFLPVLFVQQEAGQLFRDIAIAVSAGVGLSLIVSLTLIPMASSRLLPARVDASEAASEVHRNNGHSLNGHHHSEPAPEPSSGGWLGWLLRPIDLFGHGFVTAVVGINDWLAHGWLRRLGVVAGFTALAVVGSWMLIPKVEYLPSGNRNLVFGILLPPPGYNIDQLTTIGTRIEQALKPYWNAELADEADLKYPIIKDFFFVARGRQVFMGLKALRPLEAGRLVGAVREVAAGEPGTFAIGKQASLFEQGPTAGRTVDVEIVGPELEELIKLGTRVLGQVVQKIPGAQVFPKPSLDLASPEMHIEPRWEQATDMGVSAVDLGYAVNCLVDGGYAGDYYRDGIKIDLSIIGQKQFAQRTQDLAALAVATPSGELVPLLSLADVTLRSGPEQIQRRQRQRAVTVQVSPPPEMPLEDAMDVIRDQIVGPLKASDDFNAALYQINFSGTADDLRSTWESLRFNIVLALVITYLLMAALFESWFYPFVVILSVPLGALGGFIGLWILNRFVLAPLDVLTMLGFVILIGTVVNNPILIVEQALILLRQGVPLREATREAVRTRVRPIFMTTMTTLLGLLPLVLFPGAGSELYRGLGSVLLGGLLVSTVVTLFVVPAMFGLGVELQTGLSRWWHRPAAPPPPPPGTAQPMRRPESVAVEAT